MDLKLIISVELSEDETTLDIIDNGTVWNGVRPSKGEVTQIDVNFYTGDKTNAKYTHTFTDSQRNDFLNNGRVTLSLVDNSVINEYPADEYYDIRLKVNSIVESSIDSIGIDKDISIRVYERISSTENFNKIRKELSEITDAVIGLDVLKSLVNSFDPEREIKWRDIYNYVEKIIKL